MFYPSVIPDDRDARRRYRECLLLVFTKVSFNRFFSDFVDDFAESVDVKKGEFEDQLFDTLKLTGSEGRTRALLEKALRFRAQHTEFVRRLAPLLSVQPLVELATLLTDMQCPDKLRELALAESHGALGVVEKFEAFHQKGWPAWFDFLMWLDGRLQGALAHPPLIHYLTKLEAQWRAENALGARALRAWTAQHGFPLAQGGGAPRERWRGVIVEVAAGRQLTAVVWLVSGDEERPVQHLSRTLTVRPEKDDLLDALTTLINDSVAKPPLSTFLESDQRLRFDFVLPLDLLGLPVDQIRIGTTDEENEAGLLGSSHSVVIRPQAWCRLKEQNRAFVINRFERKRTAWREQKARIRLLNSPADGNLPSFVRDVRDDDQLAGLILAFDGSAASVAGKRSLLIECLKTQVLALLWVRAGAPIAGDPAVMTKYLEGILTPLGDTPERVSSARRNVEDPGRDLRDHLSFIWHVEHVELPELTLTLPEMDTP
jgi:hypothetical protein